MARRCPQDGRDLCRADRGRAQADPAPSSNRRRLTPAATALRHRRRTRIACSSSSSADCDVDAFFEGEAPDVEVPPGVSVDHIRRFEAKERVRAGYDSVIFCLGNSEFHAEALALLRRRRGGVVLAHDVRLSGLYSWTAAYRPDLLPWGFHDSLGSMYGHRIPPHVGTGGWIDYPEADRHGIYMAREAIALADRYLVHSEYAAQVARLDAAPGDAGKVEIIQYLFPDPRRAAARAARRSRSGDPQRRARRAGEADGEDRRGFRPDRRAGIRARLSPSSGPRPRRLEIERCAELRAGPGVEDRVRITGAVDDDEFRGWLERATLAVQLREYSNGETQAHDRRLPGRGDPDDRDRARLGPRASRRGGRQGRARHLGPGSRPRKCLASWPTGRRRKAMAEAGLRHAAARSFATAGRVLLRASHARRTNADERPESTGVARAPTRLPALQAV